MLNTLYKNNYFLFLGNINITFKAQIKLIMFLALVVQFLNECFNYFNLIYMTKISSLIFKIKIMYFIFKNLKYLNIL